MREILFRAKGVDNGQWIYGYLLKNINGDCAIQQEINAVKNGWWLSCIVSPVITETVGQFTGVTDKNGVKIFEGDILDYGVLYKKTTIVTFDKGCFMHDTNVLFIGCDAMEIIGNIHDNNF